MGNHLLYCTVFYVQNSIIYIKSSAMPCNYCSCAAKAPATQNTAGGVAFAGGVDVGVACYMAMAVADCRAFRLFGRVEAYSNVVTATGVFGDDPFIGCQAPIMTYPC